MGIEIAEKLCYTVTESYVTGDWEYGGVYVENNDGGG